MSPSCDLTPSVPDVFAIKDRLQVLFSCFGRVQRLDLVRTHQGQSSRFMCFLRMGCPAEEQAVAQALGMGRFGGDLVMVLTPQGTLPQRAAASGVPAVASGWPWPE